MKSATLPSPSATSLFGRLVEKFHAVMDTLIPYGYEDEAGFHYAEPPPRTRHLVRFHREPSLSHARRYRHNRPLASFHSYRIITRDIPVE